MIKPSCVKQDGFILSVGVGFNPLFLRIYKLALVKIFILIIFDYKIPPPKINLMPPKNTAVPHIMMPAVA